MKGRRKAEECETREPELHRRTVDDRMMMYPQVDPWVEAEARVDPLRKARLNRMEDACPKKGPNSRLALDRVKAELKVSPPRAERWETVPPRR